MRPTAFRDAWRRFCTDLAAVGDAIPDDVLADERTAADGLRHLSRLTVYALQWHLEFRNPDAPAFYRFDDDVVQWGGPNADNHYLRATVDPRGTYRLTGNVRGVRQLIVSTPEGDMQMGKRRVFAERSLADLVVAADGTLDVQLGPGTTPPADAVNWLPLDPAVDHVLIRQYVSDWTHDAVASFFIERLDGPGDPPVPVSMARVAGGLAEATHWLATTVPFWREYLAQRRAPLPPNTLAPPTSVPGGAADIRYGAGFWALRPGEALLVELEPPIATYWSFQLYSLPWFESLDIAHRTTSVTGHAVHRDGDGRVRLVVAGEDPGTPNWLDTEGRPSGMISYRYVWTSTNPTPSVRHVDGAAVRALLPADHPVVDRAARQAQRRERRRAIARRFRH